MTWKAKYTLPKETMIKSLKCIYEWSRPVAFVGFKPSRDVLEEEATKDSDSDSTKPIEVTVLSPVGMWNEKVVKENYSDDDDVYCSISPADHFGLVRMSLPGALMKYIPFPLVLPAIMKCRGNWDDKCVGTVEFFMERQWMPEFVSTMKKFYQRIECEVCPDVIKDLPLGSQEKEDRLCCFDRFYCCLEEPNTYFTSDQEFQAADGNIETYYKYRDPSGIGCGEPSECTRRPFGFSPSVWSDHLVLKLGNK